MKLKGEVVKKIPKEKKEKMEKTLERMNKVREEDSMFLRDKLNEKLKWLEEQRQKGTEAIKKIDLQQQTLLQQKQSLTTQILKIDGAILTLKDILNTEKPKEETK